jgi:hypothetical protein
MGTDQAANNGFNPADRWDDTDCAQSRGWAPPPPLRDRRSRCHDSEDKNQEDYALMTCILKGSYPLSTRSA